MPPGASPRRVPWGEGPAPGCSGCRRSSLLQPLRQGSSEEAGARPQHDFTHFTDSDPQTRSHEPLLQRPLPSLTPSPHLTLGNPEKDTTWAPFSGPFCCRGPRTPSATAPHQPGRPTRQSVGVRSVSLGSPVASSAPGLAVCPLSWTGGLGATWWGEGWEARAPSWPLKGRMNVGPQGRLGEADPSRSQHPPDAGSHGPPGLWGVPPAPRGSPCYSDWPNPSSLSPSALSPKPPHPVPIRGRNLRKDSKRPGHRVLGFLLS